MNIIVEQPLQVKLGILKDEEFLLKLLLVVPWVHSCTVNQNLVSFIDVPKLHGQKLAQMGVQFQSLSIKLHHFSPGLEHLKAPLHGDNHILLLVKQLLLAGDYIHHVLRIL